MIQIKLTMNARDETQRQVLLSTGRYAPGRARGWRSPQPSRLFGNATVRGRAWYKVLDAPVLALDVTVWGDRSLRESKAF